MQSAEVQMERSTKGRNSDGNILGRAGSAVSTVEGDLLVDGGVLDNCPLHAFDLREGSLNPRTLGLWISTTGAFPPPVPLPCGDSRDCAVTTFGAHIRTSESPGVQVSESACARPRWLRPRSS